MNIFRIVFLLILIAPAFSSGETRDRLGTVLYFHYGEKSGVYPQYNSPNSAKPEKDSRDLISGSAFLGATGILEVDRAFHAAQVSALATGQSTETKKKLEILSDLIKKHGHEGAREKLSSEMQSNILEQAGKIEKIVAISNDDIASAMPGRFGKGLPKELADTLISAYQKQDPFELNNALTKIQTNISKVKDPELKKQWEDALRATNLLDWQGKLTGLPDAKPVVSLVTNWVSPEGIKVRHSINQIMVTKQIFEGEYRNYCEKNGEAACSALKEKMDQVRLQYFDLSIATAMADRLGYRNSPLFDSVMAPLSATSSYLTNVAKDLLGESDNLGKAMIEFTKHPIDVAGQMGVAMCESMLHLDRTVQALTNVVYGKAYTLFHGTKEESAKILAEAVFQVATLYALPPGISTTSKMGTGALIAEATERAVSQLAANELIENALGKGAIKVAAADSLKTISRIYPATAANLIRSEPKVLELLEALKPEAQKLTTKEIVIVGPGDKLIQNLVKESPEKLLKVINEQGFEKTTQGFVNIKKLYHEAPGIFRRDLEEDHDLMLSLAKEMPDMTNKQIAEFAKYADSKKITVGHLYHLLQGRKGLSKFVSYVEWKDFYKDKAVWQGKDKNIFFITSEKADEIIKRSQTLEDFAQNLGKEKDDFKSGVWRLDLPFRLEDNPSLPNGFEAGANKQFKFGGFTTGGFPEIKIVTPSSEGSKSLEVKKWQK